MSSRFNTDRTTACAVLTIAFLLLSIAVPWAMDFPETEEEIVRSLSQPAPKSRQTRGTTRGVSRGVSGVSVDESPKVGALILFDYDSTKIKPESSTLIEEFAKAFRGELHGKRFLIIGHTDSAGSDVYNLELSRNRAQSVLQSLVDNGVDPSLLEATGAGESQPIADNNSESGRAINRRVEFIVRQ